VATRLVVDHSITDVADIRAYAEDRANVLDDPDRFGVAVIVAFVHMSPGVTVDKILANQQDLDMSLSRKEIVSIVKDLVSKGYFSPSETGFLATKKLMSALERDGVTEERLIRLDKALTKQ
jgi:hypothetical protein